MDPNSGSNFSYSQGQELGKYLIDDSGGLLEPSKPLPETYGDNKLVIMARDPMCFFAYWEATPDRFDVLRNQVGPDLWQKGKAVLRVYDVTGLGEQDAEPNSFFDVEVTFDARRWYVHVPQAGRQYVVELGFRFPDGRFLALLRSNRIALPCGVLSSQTDSRWMIVNVEEWEKMFEISTQAPGSGEIAKMMAQRWEFLRSVFSGSSGQLARSAATKEEPKP